MGYIPDSDADFNKWQGIFSPYVNLHFAALGLLVEQNEVLQELLDDWGVDYAAHLTAKAAAAAAAQKKDSTRGSYENKIREFTGVIQANVNVTNEQKAALGITIPKETRTPVPVPVTRPLGSVNNVNRLEHIIEFFDETTPSSKAKPFGVRGCELWYKIGGTPPVDASELTYLATDTKTPYIAHFNGADAGKMVHYWLRWINTRNEAGPWSETVSVTISG